MPTYCLLNRIKYYLIEMYSVHTPHTHTQLIIAAFGYHILYAFRDNNN